MQIIQDSIFEDELKKILKYIAIDSKTKAKKFNNSLFKKIEKLPYMPYKFRRSIYYDSDNVRDLIFKGYTVPYLVDKDKEQIIILDIFKWMDKYREC
jgi:plasmid stabilization system protein ParE